MARGKSKFNSTFAVLEQPAEADYWNVASVGNNNTNEAEAALRRMLEITPGTTSRFLIVNVKKGFAPKITVVLNESGGADALGCKAGEDEDEPVGATVESPPLIGTLKDPVMFPAIPPTVAVDLGPPYQEPTGSDPTQPSSVSKTPTSVASGVVSPTPALANVADLAPAPKTKGPVSLTPNILDPSKW